MSQTSTPSGTSPRDLTFAPLLDAVMAVGSELELPVVLRRIVEAARWLVDASYGALGVLDESGEELSEFLFVGIEPDTAKLIGSLPRGRGVLGELIRDPRPLRLDRLSDSPASYGLPAGHPPMSTFLGVPVRVREQVFGNLYLTDKRGGAPFNERDSQVVEALATAAGVAISNARLYAESRARERWQRAHNEVSTALLSGVEPEQVLALVARRARELTGARTAVVALPLPDGDLLVEAQDTAEFQGGAQTPDSVETAQDVQARSGVQAPVGGGGTALVGTRLARDGELGRVLLHGSIRELMGNELGEPGHRDPGGGSCGGPRGEGTGAAVPLGEAGSARGVLAVIGLAAPPVPAQLSQLEGFALQAAIALELAERRRDAERFAVHSDRDRIARDLHDLVIQRLFATGMALESATRLVPERPQEAVARVHRAVDELDTTIRELRSTIYGLQAPADQLPSLRALLLREMDAATAQLGFAPSLQLSGLLDTVVPREVALHLLAAVREALSNVSRHARAARVEVVVAVRDGALVLQVNDDGLGLPPGTRRSGLANLDVRAVELGGQLAVTSVPNQGISLTWRVPLPGP